MVRAPENWMAFQRPSAWEENPAQPLDPSNELNLIIPRIRPRRGLIGVCTIRLTEAARTLAVTARASHCRGIEDVRARAARQVLVNDDGSPANLSGRELKRHGPERYFLTRLELPAPAFVENLIFECATHKIVEFAGFNGLNPRPSARRCPDPAEYLQRP